jgi:cytochrome c oxidase accessory protein FixG
MNDEELEKVNRLHELHAERLATTDYEGNRVYLYPEDVNGIWKNRRDIFYWFLIIIYLVLPWIYIKGKPFLMLDIFKREFTVAGNTFHGVEPILIFLTLVSGIFFIGCLTSIFGRVWCGWACPQTVFIQTIFAKVETLIEGKARDRRELDRSPMSLNKFIKKVIKWTAFTILSLHITHTFAGYFVGPRELLQMSMQNPANNLGIFFAVMIATTIILIDFGWFREQFCIIACPYGRIQSVMMDENSLVIAYDDKRGEPRRAIDIKKEDEGDCINCYACVKVCPTGIDIRRGTQLECIACTNCIDACDEIMTKVNKPTGLIRYSSENELKGKTHTFFTLRSLLYGFIFLLFVTIFFSFLYRSTSLSFQIYRGIESPFQVVSNSDGTKTVLNHFTLKISHQGEKNHQLLFKIHNLELRSKITIVTPMVPFKITKAEAKTPIFFRFDPSILVNGKKIIEVEMIEHEHDHDEIISVMEAPLVGPAN